MFDGGETPKKVQKRKTSMVSLLEGYGENDIDRTITTANKSTKITTNSTLKAQKSTTTIHSLNQDFYLTEVKDDVGKLQTDLGKEQEKNLVLQKMLAKCKKDLVAQKRTITNYRKAVAEMQKDFFAAAPSQHTGQSSKITMSSIRRLSSIKHNEMLITEENSMKGQGENESQTSQAMRDHEFGDSTSKVQ